VALLAAGPNAEIQTIGQLAEGMEEMRRRTGGSVMIGMRQGIHTRYIVALRGRNPIQDDFVLGVLRPVCRVAPGKILLAQETDAEIGRIVRRANAEEEDPDLRVPLPAFLREMAEIRRQGWAESLGARSMTTGLIAIGLPVLAGQPPLALALGLPLEEARSRRGEMVADLHAVSAAAFSR
jgi:DNA-binding IclR family transcriptional regulator